MSLNDDILKVLYSEEELKAKCAEMGAQITKDYQGKNLLLVTVLKGAVVYLADLTSADRDYGDVKEVRRMADRDLDGALFYSMQFILGDLIAHGRPLQPDSLACYNEIALARADKPER